MGYKKKKVITDNLLGGGTIAVTYLLIWFILCWWKDISPLDRIKEFIYISASNYTWAYSSIGNTSLIAFGWFYVFLPFTEIILIFLLLSKNVRPQFGDIELIILIELGCFYFCNYARGLVRHSVFELGVTALCQMVILVYISLAIIGSRIMRNRYLFAPILTGIMILNMLVVGETPYYVMPNIYQGTNRIETIVESWTLSRHEKECEKLLGEERYTYWENIKNEQTVVDRIVMHESNKNEVYELEQAINTLLGEDETFLDFVCRTFFYAAYGREDPVYVSQTPSMLSNEFTQEQYIKEIKSQYEKIPIVIMPSLEKGTIGFDGVNNSVRYYKVVEYIYQNYRPLCNVSGYALWCANDRYQELSSKVWGMYEFIDWDYDSKNHEFDLQKLPYIWANYDTKEASSNEKIIDLLSVAENTYYIDGVEEIEKGIGNYLLIFISSNIDQNVTISAGNKQNHEMSSFSFGVCQGENYYLIRISSDYYWHINWLDTFSVKAMSENGSINSTMSVLVGD